MSISSTLGHCVKSFPLNDVMIVLCLLSMSGIRQIKKTRNEEPHNTALAFRA